MRIDIWSDVVCPFCYIGKRNLEAALATVTLAEPAEIVWHSFELDPHAPPVAGTHSELLASKYGMSDGQVREADRSLTAQAAAVGLDFELAASKPGNSFDAHRLLHLAAEVGLQDALKERLFRAYFTESAAISNRVELLRLAVEAGLDAVVVERVLQSDEFAEDVRGDEATAAQIGVAGVPFFVIDRQFAISGAQPVDIFTEALERATSSR